MQNSIDNVFKSLEKRTLRRVAVEIVSVHGQEDPLAYRQCDDIVRCPVIHMMVGTSLHISPQFGDGDIP